MKITMIKTRTGNVLTDVKIPSDLVEVFENHLEKKKIKFDEESVYYNSGDIVYRFFDMETPEYLNLLAFAVTGECYTEMEIETI